MKRVIAILLALMLCGALVVTASAARENVFDNADLLTFSEETQVQKALEKVSQKHNVYLYVLTVDSIGSMDSWDYAEGYYKNNGLGYGPDKDGVLLLVSMEYRDWAIYTNGVGYDAISDSESEDIGEAVARYLSDADYEEAFRTFAEECDDYINNELNFTFFTAVKTLFISLIIGAVVALIVTSILRGQLHSVRAKAGASDYVRPGSMHVTMAREFFLYRTVSRRAKPKSSSSGGGGGGSRSGGSSGKF